jgi:tetraacyldisaccharide 4'-kinase
MLVPIAAVSVLLERARLPRPATRAGRAVEGALERALGRTVVRRLTVAPGLRVVAIGGATLGGSGRTPLAIACAEHLARLPSAPRVVLVGHAYRAAPRRARVVHPHDPVAEVGDEAVLAARWFERSIGAAARVVVGPSRQAALDLAAQVADVAVLDGVAQTAPRRSELALLAVDAEEPWGNARAVPPWGDLRAPVRDLAGAVDRLVAVGEAGEGAASGRVPAAWVAETVSRGAHLQGELLGWEALAGLRVGLACALARPERVVRALARRGVRPVALVRGPDHGPLPDLDLRSGWRPARVDLWLATPKCALHLEGRTPAPRFAILDHDVALGADLAAALTAVGEGNNLAKS